MKYISILISLALLCGCNSNRTNNAKNDLESYERTKEDLLKKEQQDPVHFLTVSAQGRQNIVGQTVVKGTLSNKASVATFKDVALKLSFFSKTSALLETDKETIFELLPPGQSKNFKTKYFAPKGTDSVAIEVIAAKVVREEREN